MEDTKKRYTTIDTRGRLPTIHANILSSTIPTITVTKRMGPDSTHASNADFSRASKFGVRGRLLSNAGLLGGARLLAAFMGIATLVITANALSDNAAFGTLLFVHAYMLFFSEVASFKTWQAIIRFGSDEVKSENATRFSQLVKTGVFIDAAAAVLAFIAALACFGLFLFVKAKIGADPASETIAAQGGTDLKQLVMIYCTVILFRQTNVAIGVFRLFDKFTVIALRALVMPSVRLIGVLIAAHQGWGLVGFLCVWYLASLLSYLVLQICAVVEIYKRRFWPVIHKVKACRAADFPGLYAFIFKTNIDSTLNALKSNFPSLAVMLVFGPALLAVYRIAEEISKLLVRGVKLFDQVLYPELSRMAVDIDFKALSRTTAKTAIGMGLIGFVISVVVLLFGETILNTAFDESFADAPALAVMLLVASTIIGAATPFYTAFYVLMRPDAAIWVRLAGTVTFIGGFCVLSQSLGLFSIGWAAIGGAVIEMILVIIFIRAVLKSQRAATDVQN